MVRSLTVLLCVNKRRVDYGSTEIRNQPIIDGAAGRKVGGTVGIERYGLVAGSVLKMFKIIPICSAYVANIVGWFQKNVTNPKIPLPVGGVTASAGGTSGPTNNYWAIETGTI